MNKVALPFHLSPGRFLSYSALRLPSAGGDGTATGRFLIWEYQILEPDGEIVTLWNHIFLISSIIALFIDPLYFFLPYVGTVCMSVDYKSGIAITVWRTIADLFFLLHIVFKFRTAYVKPNSRVFGKGELVMDARQIAMRYLKTDFVVDLAASLPLPQFLIWVVLPSSKDSSDNANNTVALIVLIQYVPRLFQILPLNHKIVKNNGFIAKTAWAGAAYNLLLYILASHVSGAIWYLCSIARQQSCWNKYCALEHAALLSCVPSFLDCRNEMLPERLYWLNVTTVPKSCDASKDDIDFKFGMFADAFTDDVATQRFFTKYLYCLWWGIKNLSSYGSNQDTTIYIGENLFCVLICIIGLILFSLLIGNMQTSLQSLTVRIEEWRLKRRDTEEWMRHRQLPPDLQERVHRFTQYKWLATRGVDEESILQSLPPDLRREIQRHLCLSLVRRVPFFSQMDDQLLDAICGRLVSSLSTEGTFIVREGDPVDEMLFIIRGQLESSTTNGGRSGFFNTITLRPGDFCGEELLTWALMPNSTLILPSSTRTVKALTEVEGFALYADDLTFVAHQFKRLQSKKLQHAFRYYSHQWRGWGACYIQTAWRRFKRKKMHRDLLMHENCYNMRTSGHEGNYGDRERSLTEQNLGATMVASKVAANLRKGTEQNLPEVDSSSSSLKMPKLFKPDEPDFST